LTVIIRFITQLIALFGLLPTAISAAERCVGEENCVLGVFPHTGSHQLAQTYGAIAEDFKLVLDTDLRLKSSRSLKSFGEELEKHQYDIAMVGPGQLLTHALPAGYRPVVQVDRSIRFYLIGLRASGITSPQQWQNRTFGLLAPNSATSIMGLQMLRNNGLHNGENLTLKEFRTAHACAFALASHLVDGCSVASPIYAVIQQQVHTDFKVIQESVPVPSAVMVVHPDLHAEQVESLKAYLLDRGGYKPFDAKEYQLFVDILAERTQ